MTKTELLTWLRTNRPYLNITAIGRDAGIPNLRNIVGRHESRPGVEATLGDRHVERLKKVIDEIKC